MIKIIRVVEFDFGDYFSKFGFGDGDDGVQRDIAEDFIEDAIKFTNVALKKHRVKGKATRLELHSIHNDVQIALPEHISDAVAAKVITTAEKLFEDWYNKLPA